MNETGHSRLLKYIIADNKSPEMDEPTIHKLVIEVFTPSAIQSELPSNCPIRHQENNANETLTDDHKVKANNAITVNVTDEDKNIACMKEEELKSKIPVPSFRRVKNKNKDNLQVPQPKPRGDIPITNQLEEFPNNDNKRNTVKDFDRLFQEVNDNGRITSMDLEILRDITAEDPEKVDGFFEEIIHAYEEKKKEIKEPNIEINNSDIKVDNTQIPQIQINVDTSSLSDNNVVNSETDTTTHIINNFDEQNSFKDNHKHVLNNKPTKPIRTFHNKNTNVEPSVPINTNVTKPIINSNNEVIPQPIYLDDGKSAELIIPLNTEVIIQPVTIEPIAPNSETFECISNEVSQQPINVSNGEFYESIVPINTEVIVPPIYKDPIVPITTKTDEPIVIINNELIPQPTNMENSGVIEAIVPLNTEVIEQPFQMEPIHPINTVTAEPIVILSNEVIPQPISGNTRELYESVVPLNTEIPIVPINKEVAIESIISENVDTVEPIVLSISKIHNQGKPEVLINTETSAPIVTLNKELIIESANVEKINSVKPIVLLNEEILIQPSNMEPIDKIDTKQVEPIIPINNIVLKDFTYVENMNIEESNKQLNTDSQAVNNKYELHLNNKETTSLDNEMIVDPINTETVESIVPLNNELIIESVNVGNAEYSEPPETHTISITPEYTEPIVKTEIKINKLGNTINNEKPQDHTNVIDVERLEGTHISLDANLNPEKVSLPILHNMLNDVVKETINNQNSTTMLSIVSIEPVAVNETPEIVEIKADNLVIENSNELSQIKLLNNVKIEQSIQKDIIINKDALEHNMIEPVDTTLNFIEENVEVYENSKDNKPSRIPRRFNNNIKVYPTTDETNSKVDFATSDITKDTPSVINDIEKIQSIFQTMKSFEEPKQNEVKIINKYEDTVIHPNDSIKVKEYEKVNNIEKAKAKPEVISVVKKSNTQDDIKANIENINKIRRFKSMPTIDNDIAYKIKKRSVAEMDLGERIKGRVGSMVQRMTSIENSKNAPKELIHKIEVPKKQSVLDRVAMFEKKTALSRMEASKDKHSRSTKQTEVNTEVKTEEMYKEKIEELKNAKNKYEKAPFMPVIELNNGQNMPVLAIGTALIEPVLIKYVIEAAIDLGYRAIDTAFIYGNERLIGEAIKAKIDDGTVKREDLFIINKLWSTFHKPELVEKACRASLEQLGLDYFDLYLIHCPMSFKEGKDVVPKIANVVQYSTSDYLDAWIAMEALVKKGLAKGIGVSNFNSQQLTRILEKGTVKPVVNQVESHPYLNQQRLNEFCAIRDIRLSCFATLGSKGTPKELKCSDMAVVDDPLVKVLAAAIGKTPAQMLIRYQLEHERNVIVKTSSAAHLWDNLQALTFKLTTEEIDALNALNKNKRYFAFIGMGDTHKNYPFTIPF